MTNHDDVASREAPMTAAPSEFAVRAFAGADVRGLTVRLGRIRAPIVFAVEDPQDFAIGGGKDVNAAIHLAPGYADVRALMATIPGGPAVERLPVPVDVGVAYARTGLPRNAVYGPDERPYGIRRPVGNTSAGR